MPLPWKGMSHQAVRRKVAQKPAPMTGRIRLRSHSPTSRRDRRTDRGESRGLLPRTLIRGLTAWVGWWNTRPSQDHILSRLPGGSRRRHAAHAFIKSHVCGPIASLEASPVSAEESSSVRKVDHFPCTFTKACHVLWAVRVLGWSQTKAAIVLGLNSGTVSHVVNGRRHPNARPLPFADRRTA